MNALHNKVIHNQCASSKSIKLRFLSNKVITNHLLIRYTTIKKNSTEFSPHHQLTHKKRATRSAIVLLLPPRKPPLSLSFFSSPSSFRTPLSSFSLSLSLVYIRGALRCSYTARLFSNAHTKTITACAHTIWRSMCRELHAILTFFFVLRPPIARQRASERVREREERPSPALTILYVPALHFRRLGHAGAFDDCVTLARDHYSLFFLCERALFFCPCRMKRLDDDDDDDDDDVCLSRFATRGRAALSRSPRFSRESNFFYRFWEFSCP